MNDRPLAEREICMIRAIIVVAILALTSVVAIFACGKSDKPKTPQVDAASVAPGAGSPASANTKLERAVKARFDTDERLKAANISINADVTKNEVTLSGTVDSEAIRSKAVELAKSAHAGVIVNDKINVKPHQSNSLPPHATVLV
jgi:osmotically-inducible protein OsmY